MTSLPTPSSPRTANSWPAVLTELRYLLWSRQAVGVLAIHALAASAAVIGLVMRASTRLSLFERSLEESRRNGITLDQALSQPVEMTQDAQGQLIHNILRFDYENAQRAIGSLRPLGFAVNTVQLLSFVVIPAVCVVVGVVLTTRDYRFGTLKIRAARTTLLSLHGGQWLACVIVNLVALGMAVVISLGAAPVARAVFLHRHAGRLIGSLGGPPSVGEFTLTIALTAAVTVFFSTVGIGLGLLFRRALAPALLFIAWNTMCPMLGRWDPRSLWSSLGHRVFRFDGVFTLSDVPLTSPAAAVPVLLALPVLIVAAGHLTAVRVSRFSTS